MCAFRDNLIEQIQKRVPKGKKEVNKNNNQKDAHSSCVKNAVHAEKNTELAIQFIFGNNKLLELLEQRADALKDRNFEKAGKIEEKMTKYKNENFEKLMRPIHALIIFQDD